MLQIALNPGLPDGRWACLRPLCGHDELAVGVDDLGATRLVDGLLVSAPGTAIGPGAAWEISVTDRDRLLAELYRLHFGDRIEGAAECQVCHESFDLGCTLTELAGALNPAALELANGPDAEGIYDLPDGRRFRLPTPGDQRNVLGMDTDAAVRSLLERCLVAGEVGGDTASLEAAIAEAGPVLDLDLSAPCPECGTVQSIRFDIQRHLLRVLANERPWLLREVHSIARTYHWPLEDILALSRDDRRRYVSLIEAERPVGTGARNG